MRQLRPEDMAVVERVLASENPAAQQEIRLWVAGRDETEWFSELEWGREDAERPGVVLACTIARPVPLSSKGEDVSLVLVCGGVPIEHYAGEVVVPEVRRGLTVLEAGTGGYWLDKVKLGSPENYTGWSPSQVAYDVLTRNLRYDLTSIEIEDVPGPTFQRNKDEGYRRIDALSDVLGAVAEEAEMFFRDTFTNGHRGTKERGPADAGEPVATFVVGRDIEPDEWDPTPTGGEFSEVLVYREDRVEGELTELALAPVIGSSAPPNAYYEIQLSGEDSRVDGEPVDLDLEAWQRAVEVSTRLERGEAEASCTLGYIHPLIEDGDVVAVVEEEETLVRTWLCEVRQNRPNGEKRHALELVMVVASEVAKAVPDILPLAPLRAFTPAYARAA